MPFTWVSEDLRDTGNTAFLIICTALVLMMTPALAFFYGGLVRAKSVISMMMLSFAGWPGGGFAALLWALGWGRGEGHESRIAVAA